MTNPRRLLTAAMAGVLLLVAVILGLMVLRGQQQPNQIETPAWPSQSETVDHRHAGIAGKCVVGIQIAMVKAPIKAVGVVVQRHHGGHRIGANHPFPRYDLHEDGSG